MPAAEAYKLELPKDFKLPQGVEFKFDDSDPVSGQVIKELRAFANARGIDQDGFSGLLSLHAAAKASEQAHLNAARDAEVAKLGAAGVSRVGTVETWLDASGYSDLKPMIVSAKIVETFERLINRVTSQGASGPNTAHRERPEGGKIPGYEKMSFAQIRHAQEQLRPGTR